MRRENANLFGKEAAEPMRTDLGGRIRRLRQEKGLTIAQLAALVEKCFDLRPAAIIRDLDLRRPIYRKLAAYGHMGREDLGVSWEKTDRVQALLDAVK